MICPATGSASADTVTTRSTSTSTLLGQSTTPTSRISWSWETPAGQLDCHVIRSPLVASGAHRYPTMAILKVARTSCAAQPERKPKWRPFSMETATRSDSLAARSTCRRTLTSTEEPKLVKLKGLSSRSVHGQTVTSLEGRFSVDISLCRYVMAST